MKNIPFDISADTIALIFSSFFILSSFSISSKSRVTDEVLILCNTIPDGDYDKEEVFIIVQEFPRFPGCEDLEDKSEKEDCAQKKILEHIYGNLQYPALARENKVEGQVVLQFVVTKEGYIADIQIIRDLDDGCGEEALKVVQSMNDLPERWTPGKQRGNLVNVKYTLPVKFKLD